MIPGIQPDGIFKCPKCGGPAFGIIIGRVVTIDCHNLTSGEPNGKYVFPDLPPKGVKLCRWSQPLPEKDARPYQEAARLSRLIYSTKARPTPRRT